MAHHSGVTILVSQLNGLNGFGESTDLVNLDEDTVGNTFGDSVAQALCVGDEQVVADQLNSLSEFIGQLLPPVPVIFGAAVFN